MHLIFAALVLPVAGPAYGFSCGFDMECYEAEDCAASDFTTEVTLDREVMETAFGDLTIVAVKEDEGLITLFATGAGSEYLISVTPDAARLTAHVNDGPQVISYLGTCEGAF